MSLRLPRPAGSPLLTLADLWLTDPALLVVAVAVVVIVEGRLAD